MLVLDGAAPRRAVDIVVAGEPGAGKTSLITTLVSSIFPEAVPRVLQQVRVPPEETADRIALSITDTSSAEQDRALLLKQVAQADVVVLVYAADRPESFDRVEKYWLPEFCKIVKGPVVVVGNKSDLAAGGANEGGPPKGELRVKVEPVLAKFRQVDAWWECSAKLNINVSDVFSLAQQAVVYPIAPLFDTQRRELLPKFKTALLRVFRIFDQDRDGVLSDVELNDFQETCFGARLQPSDIEDVKNMLQNEGPGRVTSFGITFEGYLSIHRKFIERNRAETSWLVLRQFGYDDQLNLQIPAAALDLSEAAGWNNDFGVRERSLELSKRALTFFADLFHQFDQDKDQALSPRELENLFSICPSRRGPWELGQRGGGSDAQGRSPRIRDPAKATASTSGSASPGHDLLNAEAALADLRLGPSNATCAELGDFPAGTRVDESGNVTLAGWLAEWAMVTLLQPRLTLLYLYFLGFDRTKESALVATRPRSVENECNSLERSVVRAFVFGAQGVGKSSLLEALVGQPGAVAAGTGGPSGLRPAGVSEQHLGMGSGMKGSPSNWTFASELVGDEDRRTDLFRNAISRIRVQGGGSGSPQGTGARFFCLTEVGTDNDALEEALSNCMVDCDLAVLVFDSTNPSSVDWLRGVQKRIPESVPCVYVASKVDLLAEQSAASGLDETDFRSQAIQEASNLCTANSLPLPELISLHHASSPKLRQRLTRLFELLLSAALRPDAARPISEERRARQRRARLAKAALRVSLVASVAAAGGLLLWSWTSRRATTRPSSESGAPPARPVADAVAGSAVSANLAR